MLSQDLFLIIYVGCVHVYFWRLCDASCLTIVLCYIRACLYQESNFEKNKSEKKCQVFFIPLCKVLEFPLNFKDDTETEK
jgi:hypothetical protein